jgi:hypothetical protein
VKMLRSSVAFSEGVDGIQFGQHAGDAPCKLNAW